MSVQTSSACASMERDQHKASHMAQKRHRCTSCDACYSQRSSLKQHIRIVHSGAEPAKLYKCDICSKDVRSFAPYARHSLIHTGDKPFSCETCEKQFSRADGLKLHRLVHTGDKPHKCKICNSEFIQSSGLKSHMLKHSQEDCYMCDICSGRFVYKKDLIKHIIQCGK